MSRIKSDAPTCKVNDSLSARSQQYPVSKILEGKSLNEFEKMLAKYMAIQPTGQKQVEEKPVAEKPEVQKPVEQKPATEKPVQKPVEQKPATPAPAPEKPVEQKPATPSQPEQEKPDTSISAIEKQVLTLTNQERAKGGLKPLATDAPLTESARAKSTDMRSNNYFDHNSPTLGSPFDQMKARGIDYKSAAENIAMRQRTPEEVVKGWMNSPGHRANIMNGNYTHIGIGYDAQGHYWTQQFIQK
ncbi:CAP domain-containing protein [Paenibacillus crassostreae]|uniref:CAP domain-containing protein n=1 Tax=Paenibacillus crassostreae TaxID=1763538 RepID=UPI003AAC125C